MEARKGRVREDPPLFVVVVGDFDALYGRKLAATVLARLMLTVQLVPEVVSHPVQPLKRESTSGVAVRVTTVPML